MSDGHRDHCPQDTGISQMRRKSPSELIFQSSREFLRKSFEIVDMQKNVPIGLEVPELQYAYIFWEIFETSYYHIIIFSQEDVLNSDQEKMQKQNFKLEIK